MLDQQLRGETWASVWAQNPEKAAAFMQTKLGYVIQPGELFSDWQAAINVDQFNITNVADALVHFNQGIQQGAKATFEASLTTWIWLQAVLVAIRKRVRRP